jgi:hypothetical protein
MDYLATWIVRDAQQNADFVTFWQSGWQCFVLAAVAGTVLFEEFGSNVAPAQSPDERSTHEDAAADHGDFSKVKG